MAEREEVVSTYADDHAPFWRAKSTNVVHKVAQVIVVWRGPSASWERPRIVVTLECRSLEPKDKSAGLTHDASWGRCSRCFRGER